ncbi:hypothetical protein XJ44_08495 [Thermosipho affectus]|uniref:Uncharacterized protein n=1 Tax=Thermosipho affectus TaxID=660294 RepID=A0ABX3IFA0_9BACT|nr:MULTISPECIES: hypothetical protein [unclassified Thermosipho (in: thermotogales)]MBT1247879.1 hypothetical protein [Thermosipho sp. 1244]ONN26496.1 hypothetical protein XJ44_08495 [Thermosipho affectus]OOC42330.1 hypothetical protein XO08_08645 [Thermosipho sp. 1074]OOC45425.1 hypothetical protein XO09_08580 [Thermosipho sp. 1223]ANQ54674.1 hypothetical protein Y592_08680 [Thermosipho sp. 1070]
MRKILRLVLNHARFFFDTFIDVENKIWTYLLFTLFDVIYLYKFTNMYPIFGYDIPHLNIYQKILLIIIWILYIGYPMDIYIEKKNISKKRAIFFSVIFIYEIPNFTNIQLFLFAGKGDVVYRVIIYFLFMAIVILIHPLNKKRILFRK